MLKYMEWWNSEANLEELRVMCEKYVWDFCLIHGDFSPHNCLFTKKENWEYTLWSVLDPSWRTSFWMAEFDIAYALNNRWIIDKESFEKWFIEEYNFDINSDLFSKLEEVMKSYLKTLYKHLADEEIKKRELKNVKTTML